MSNPTFTRDQLVGAFAQFEQTVDNAARTKDFVADGKIYILQPG